MTPEQAERTLKAANFMKKLQGARVLAASVIGAVAGNAVSTYFIRGIETAFLFVPLLVIFIPVYIWINMTENKQREIVRNYGKTND